jgi:hypothetical protein
MSDNDSHRCLKAIRMQDVPAVASGNYDLYHSATMPLIPGRKWLIFFTLLFAAAVYPLRAADETRTIPISDVKPGMKGVVYTIFEGDQIEKVQLEVIGILNNALGPKQDVILVKLLGDKADKTGVAAGMSAVSENREFHQGCDRRGDAHRQHVRCGEILGRAGDADEVLGCQSERSRGGLGSDGRSRFWAILDSDRDAAD